MKGFLLSAPTYPPLWELLDIIGHAPEPTATRLREWVDKYVDRCSIQALTTREFLECVGAERLKQYLAHREDEACRTLGAEAVRGGAPLRTESRPGGNLLVHLSLAVIRSEPKP